MRELTMKEIEQVSGGSIFSTMADMTIGDFASEGGAIGSLIGAVVTNSIRGAMLGGAYGAVGGAAFGGGLYLGGRVLEWWNS